MCKIFVISGIKSEHLPKVAKLTKNIAKGMSFAEDDGVGYAAITKSGQIYGEKWLNKDDAFNVHDLPPTDAVVTKLGNMFGETLEWDKPPVTLQTYATFGDRTSENIDNTVAIILHARKATQGGKTLDNVHPFVEPATDETPATALIHNGSISNHDKLTKKYSTCDSEVILHEYMANLMYHNPWGVEQLAKTLVGTYTVGVVGSQLIDDVWTPYIDIFKSNKELWGGYVPELETVVFCTSQYTLETALKESDMTIKNIFKLKDGFLHRLNAITGERMEAPISFAISSQFPNSYNRQHENSMVKNARVAHSIFPYGPAPRIVDDTIDSAKKHFERKHPALFTTPYLESKITPEERSFFDELEKNKETNHAALRLVSAALNMDRA